VSRRQVRGATNLGRWQQRDAGRHYIVGERLPGGGEHEPYLAGSRVTECRRGRIVSVDIDPGVTA
jgi:hypothetical protein